MTSCRRSSVRIALRRPGGSAFGAPITLAEGEDRRAFLDRAREAVVALQPGESQAAPTAPVAPA